jgi:hypothetical protein
MIHEKLYKKLELLITTEEGRKLAKLKSKPQNLQLIESLINDFSELIVNEGSIDMNRVTDMLTKMHEEMMIIYGRGD